MSLDDLRSVPAHPARPAAVLELAFREATGRFEDSLARVRLALCLLITAVIAAVWAAGIPGRTAAVPALTAAITLAGALASLGALAWLRRHPPTRPFLAVSVALDTLVILGASLPGALWPYDAYPGQLHFPPIYFFVLAIVASGLRMKIPVVGIAAVVNVAAIALLVALDAMSGAGLVRTRALDWGFFAVLLIGAVFIASTIVRRTRTLATEGAHSLLAAERARKALGLYVSEEVASHALAAEQLTPGGQRREVTVLFSDLRGFTAYSKTLSPEALVEELNGYLDAMVRVIREEGGIVDKFIGDAIMVVFGLTRTQGDEAARAVRAAWRMEEALAAHNQARAARGRPPLRHGIGAHRGAVVVGDIGSEHRLQYTVIGEAVNLASRLEAATKDAGVPVLLSAALVEAAGEVAGAPAPIPLPPVKLRGVEEPMAVFGLGEASG